MGRGRLADKHRLAASRAIACAGKTHGDFDDRDFPGRVDLEPPQIAGEPIGSHGAGKGRVDPAGAKSRDQPRLHEPRQSVRPLRIRQNGEFTRRAANDEAVRGDGLQSDRLRDLDGSAAIRKPRPRDFGSPRKVEGFARRGATAGEREDHGGKSRRRAFAGSASGF